VWELADGADLLVLGAETLPRRILQVAPIPVLLSRWLPFNDDIAARILIVVDQAVDPDRAAEIAGALAARRGGEVIILPSLARSRSLQRSMAASRRIVLETTGVWPEVLGDELAREAATPSAVRAIDPSIVVLPLGDTPDARAPAVSIARLLTCPVLAVPSTT
jgi:nucleotide-binding universal stress UspA family protein